MNELIKPLQRDLGFTGADVDGVRGPKTNSALFAQADLGNLKVIKPIVSGGVTLMPDEPPWITALKVAFGWHEVHDRDKLSVWLRSDGKTLGDPSKEPWCGDATETSMKNAGFALDPKVAANPYWARNWLFFGVSVDPIPFGAVLVFERDGGFGHVGYGIGQDSDEYYVLGGNQSNMIGISRLAKNRLLGARMPANYNKPFRALPIMSAGSIPKSVNEF